MYFTSITFLGVSIDVLKLLSIKPEDFTMKKLKMARAVTLTFEEGCNKYSENCRQRNLREGTIEHYKQSYTQF